MRAATAALAKLRSGSVIAAKDINAQEVNVGLTYNVRPDSVQIVAMQLRSLRDVLARVAAESGTEPAWSAARVADAAVRELETAGSGDVVPVLDRINTVMGLLSSAAHGVEATSAAAGALASGFEAAIKVYRAVESLF
jgi:hypothetical protein